jgi:hypothetical protein
VLRPSLRSYEGSIFNRRDWVRFQPALTHGAPLSCRHSLGYLRSAMDFGPQVCLYRQHQPEADLKPQRGVSTMNRKVLAVAAIGIFPAL